MNQSENINELVAALAKAQAVMPAAELNEKGHHGRYADFRSCIEACRKPLTENGLAIMQMLDHAAEKPILVTMLSHTSGQWVKSFYPLMLAKNDNQGLGAAVTYAKRYSLCAIIGLVADEDDDGNQDKILHEKAKIQNKPKEMSIAAPKKDTRLISVEQVNNIKETMREIPGEYVSKFSAKVKENYGVEMLADLPLDSYDRVMKSLQDIKKLVESEKKVNANA